ncbi:MAG: aldehyde dehydrogenase family protein [Oligoflexia bacterium]|nr:aldehyde dehydrogenase family protein [Oligoflexia bacterium]
MNTFLGDYINGEFVKPLQTNGNIVKNNPANTKEIIFEGGFKFDHVNLVCAAAKKAFKSWSTLSLNERKRYLLKLKEGYVQQADDLANAISKEVGKPLWEAKQEVAAMINKIDITLSEALLLIEEKKIEQATQYSTGYIRFKPRGVMVVVGPFNFPGLLPNNHIASALITGNAVVFKPSEFTPYVGQLIAEIFDKVEFPQGVFNLIQGNAEVGRRLVMHDEIEGILFTGSYETGFKIKQDTLTHFWKICALEMGGKNAAIVWDDCDFNKAIYETLKGAYITTGQRCSSTSRLIIRKSIYDKFLESFHNAAKKLTVGDPFKNPFMGPLISAESKDKYLRFQSIAQRENCETLMRAKELELENNGYFVTPSINLVRKPDGNSIYQKSEIFGPNVAVYCVEEIDEAIQIVNQSSYGLVCSVFSKDERIFEKCFSSIRVGMINWNKSTIGASAKLPFGGMGKSGNNRPAGIFDVYTTTYPVSCLQDESEYNSEKLLPGMSL